MYSELYLSRRIAGRNISATRSFSAVRAKILSISAWEAGDIAKALSAETTLYVGDHAGSVLGHGAVEGFEDGEEAVRDAIFAVSKQWESFHAVQLAEMKGAVIN
jgi:hypothetical protein